jgi:hypothetical protein
VFSFEKLFHDTMLAKLEEDVRTHVQETGAPTQLSQLLGQIEARVSMDMDEAVVAAGFKARRAANEEMNQIVRRLRQCRSTEEVAAWLLDATAPFSCQAALFEVASESARGVRARGFPVEQARFEQLEIPLGRAPAFAHCVRECDTVVAIGAAAEVSAEVIAALGAASGEKIYLYPLVIEGKTVALLYATAGGEAGRQFVDGAALELLTQAAAGAAQILSNAPIPGADLVKIEGVDMAQSKGGGTAMLRRAREARARWYARAAVAGMRLRRAAAVQKGRAQHDIYSALKAEIDTARRVYQQDYLAVSPVITDYLHRELLQLANDDASLLGPDYPGRLV